MPVGLWIALVGGAFLAGAAFVGVLVVRRGAELIVAIGGAAGLALSAWAFSRINDVYPRVDAILYAFVLGLAALGGGYALASALLDKLATDVRPYRGRLADRPRPERIAVALFTCTEPESYSPSVTAREIASLTDEGLLEAGIGVMPFLYTAQKARYRAAGGRSPAYRQLRQVAEQLETLFSDAGRPLHAEAASCAGEGSLPDAVGQLVDRGFGTIVIAPYAVSDSLSMDSALRMVDAMRLDTSGVTVTLAEPLWGSDEVATMVANRALAATSDVQTTGVVLVAHGQPDLRELRNPRFDEHETAFVSRIRMLLVEQGIPTEHVKIGWSEWRDPDVTAAVRHLAALGCSRILVVPAVYSVESIGTVLDLPMAVRQARVDDWVSVIVLPAWRDDPIAISALRDRVERALSPAERASQ
ncbi:MAG: ferrochelatase [Coriobacteriales bacterium]|nr:ferrochelatase [Coriobacteriales bacterium]